MEPQAIDGRGQEGPGIGEDVDDIAAKDAGPEARGDVGDGLPRLQGEAVDGR
jgi:hypothetical protein